MQDEAIKCDLGRGLLKLEELQDGAIQEALALKDAVPTLMDREQSAALALLKGRGRT